MGLGIASLQTSQKKEPASQPGPPFAATSAFNGCSVDPVTGKIVLGNDMGDATMPAGFVSFREIALLGFWLDIIDIVGGNNRIRIQSNDIQIDDLGTGNQFKLDVGNSNVTMGLATTVAGQPTLFSLLSAAGAIGFATEGPTQISIQDAVKAWAIMLTLGVMHIRDNSGAGNGVIMDPVANNVASTGTLSSADPGAGAGAWKLGKVRVGAVALDVANYVEVMVDGVLVKLLKAV